MLSAMRTTIIILPLLFATTVCGSRLMEDMLATNQYILATQQGCLTQFETEVKPGICPQILQKPPISGHCHSKSVRAHLVRDPDGVKAPKLALVHNMEDGVYFKIWDINSTEFQNSERRMINHEFPAVASNTMIFKQMKGVENAVFVGSLFDSQAQMLYLMASGPAFDEDGYPENRFYLDAYQIIDIFNETTRTKSVKIFRTYNSDHPFCMDANIHSSKINLGRFDWGEDAYTGEFYYREQNGPEIVTYSAPFARIFDVILTGTNGKIVSKTTEGGLLSVSAGLFSEKKIEKEGFTKTVTSFFRPLKSNLTQTGIKCEYTDDNATLPHHTFNQVIVIKDYDYCLLKYGDGYSKEACDQERMEWFISKGLKKASPENTIKWLIISVIALSVFVLLLLAYIYWLRSTFAVETDRTLQNDQFEAEASVFIAKQRSFPSAYPDPALLDVSVDRWN